MAQIVPPVVQMDEVLGYLSERGKLEWELALTKAQLVKALTPTTEGQPVESGHIPSSEATNQLTGGE